MREVLNVDIRSLRLADLSIDAKSRLTERLVANIIGPGAEITFTVTDPAAFQILDEIYN